MLRIVKVIMYNISLGGAVKMARMIKIMQGSLELIVS